MVRAAAAVSKALERCRGAGFTAAVMLPCARRRGAARPTHFSICAHRKTSGDYQSGQRCKLAGAPAARRSVTAARLVSRRRTALGRDRDGAATLPLVGCDLNPRPDDQPALEELPRGNSRR